MKKWIIPAAVAVTGLAAWAGYLSPQQGSIIPVRSASASTEVINPKRIAKNALRSATADNAFTLPVELTPTQTEVEKFIIVDGNGDGTTWKLDSGFMKYGYSPSNFANDWFYVPLQLSATDRVLSVSFKLRAEGSYRENLDVAFGNAASASAMTTVLSVENFTNTAWEVKTVEISNSGGAGVYYLGFHACSDADMYGIRLKDIVVETVNGNKPMPASIVSSSVNEMEYSATIALPALTTGGEAIDGNVGLTVSVDGVQTEDYPDCTPGSQKTVTMTLGRGAHTIGYTTYRTVDGSRAEGATVTEQVRIVATGQAYSLPFEIGPTADEFEDEFIVIDSNDDGKTWYYDNGALRYQYSSTNVGDDWVIFPAIDFGADNGSYDIAMEVSGGGASFTETFEIYVGTSASVSDMTLVLTPEAVKQAGWGTRSGKFSLAQGGKKYLALHVTSPKDQYYLLVKNVTISRSTDATPAVPVINSLTLNGLEGELAVTLPSVTVDGIGLDGNVGAVVTVDGVEYTTVEAQAPGSDVNIPITLTLGKHTVGVAAYTEKDGVRLTGAQALYEVLAHNPEGYAYPIPFTMHPTLGEFETLTIVDANNDGLSWEYNAGAANGAGAAVCRTAAEETADDWLIFPAVAVTDATRVYEISVEARAYLERFPETFTLCIGTAPSPEAMEIVARADNYATYLYAPLKGEWIAPAAGKYYVGVHRISDGTAHTLSIMNVSVTDAGKSMLAPAACPALDAVGVVGELSALVTVTFPQTAIDGSLLNPSETLTATVTSATGAQATVSGLPGATATATVAAPDGYSTITVVVSSPTYGAGEPAEVSVYCGVDRPSAPEVTAVVSEDNMQLVLTWTDSDRGELGGGIDVSALSHKIYLPIDAQGLYWTMIGEVPVGTNSYTFDAELLQQITYVGVSAVNSKGESQLGLGYGVTGTPYSIPLTEKFAGGNISYLPVVIEQPDETYSAAWAIVSLGELLQNDEYADTYVLVNYPEEAGQTKGAVSLPKFSTVGAVDPTVTVSYLGSANSGSFSVYASTYGTEPVELGTSESHTSAGFYEQTFALPVSLLGRPWVELELRTAFTGENEMVAFSSYSVASNYTSQLAVRLDAPTEMTVGETYRLTATVANETATEATLPASVALSAVFGSEVLAIEPAEAPASMIPAYGKIEIVYDITPTAEMLGDLRLEFSLGDFTDQVPEDNSDYADVKVVRGGRPVVTDLTGIHSDEALTLTWSAPEMADSGHATFEDYEPFAYGRNLGAWLNIDGDGKVPYGLGVDFPGSDAPKAFQVMNATAERGLDLDLKAYSGEQYLLAVCPDDDTAADDWLISPEVVGGSTVSFRFNVLSSLYGTEQIDLMYSTTGREPSDFMLLQTYSQNMRGWNPLEKTLPADARYFAFHYRSAGIFGVALDDVFYSPLGEAPLAGYNVYHNGVKVAASHPETTYTVSSWASGDRFNVAAVVANNGEEIEHPLSNTFIATTSGLGDVMSFGVVRGEAGAVVIEGMDGQDVVIIAPDGKAVASVAGLGHTARVAVPAGIYIVRLSGGAIAKVLVY